MANVPCFIVISVLVLIAITSVAVAEDVEVTNSLGTFFKRTIRLLDECGETEITICLKEQALRYLESNSGNVEIMEGVTLKRTTTPEQETNNNNNSDMEHVSVPVVLPSEPDARANVLDNLLVEHVGDFLATHSLELQMPSLSGAEETSRSESEGRRKKRRRRLLLPLLLLLKLKAVILLPLVFGAIALIAFKALVIGKVALVAAGLSALKKLFENKQPSQTYEVIAHPHHTHSHITSVADEHHGPYYRRAHVESPEAQAIPYSAYVQSQPIYGRA